MLLKLNILLLFLIIDRFVYSDSQKLLLTVYYESKCPDSKVFILQQLQPAYHLLHQYITIKFVPFGKARSIRYGDGGFECQHGATECLGNIIQDCSLSLMKGRSDGEKLAYVACEMNTQAGSQGNFDEFASESAMLQVRKNLEWVRNYLGNSDIISREYSRCVEAANLQIHLVKECVLFGKGTSLQIESEYNTNLVKPKFIPTITINGVFNKKIQDYAQVDLIGTLCSLITDARPCSGYYNSLALHNLLRPNIY